MTKFILALDPSGAYHEGKGTTGWCLMDAQTELIQVSSLSAHDFPDANAYWRAHLDLLAQCQEQYHDLGVVMEDYLLYGSKAQSQINSRFETVQLIGIIKHYCHEHQIPLRLQPASMVKARWADAVLEYKGIIARHGKGWKAATLDIPLNRHSMDAIRHAMHYALFHNK